MLLQNLARWRRAIFNYTTEAVVLYLCLFFVFLPVLTGSRDPLLLIAQKAAGIMFSSIYVGYALWIPFKMMRGLARAIKRLWLKPS